MAPRTDHMMRIPSGVTSTIITNHATKGSVFINLRNAGNLRIGVLGRELTVADFSGRQSGEKSVSAGGRGPSATGAVKSLGCPSNTTTSLHRGEVTKMSPLFAFENHLNKPLVRKER